MIDPAHMGEVMRKRRVELGLRLRDVADRAGSSPSRIWEMEKGNVTNPTLRLTLAVCDALAISLNELLGMDLARSHLTNKELRLIAAHREIFGEQK